MMMNRSTKVLFGRQALGRTFSEDYIDWAYEMLEQDYDTPQLRILAGLDRRSSMFEVDEYFKKSLKELSIEPLEPKAAVRAYACDIAQQIIDGQFPASRQTMKALRQLWLDSEYDDDYDIWSDLDEACDYLSWGDFPYTYPTATLDNFDEILKKEAAQFIVRMTTGDEPKAQPPETQFWGRWIADRIGT
jgi:hypothetical protein